MRRRRSTWSLTGTRMSTATSSAPALRSASRLRRSTGPTPISTPGAERVTRSTSGGSTIASVRSRRPTVKRCVVVARIEALELVERRLEAVQRAAQRLDEAARQRGRRQLLPVADEERIAEEVAQSAERVRDGRLRQVELLGGRRDAALGADGVEHDEQVQIDLVELHHAASVPQPLDDGVGHAPRGEQRQVAEIVEDAVFAGGRDRRRRLRHDDRVGARPDRGVGQPGARRRQLRQQLRVGDEIARAGDEAIAAHERPLVRRGDGDEPPQPPRAAEPLDEVARDHAAHRVRDDVDALGAVARAHLRRRTRPGARRSPAPTAARSRWCA